MSRGKRSNADDGAGPPTKKAKQGKLRVVLLGGLRFSDKKIQELMNDYEVVWHKVVGGEPTADILKDLQSAHGVGLFGHLHFSAETIKSMTSAKIIALASAGFNHVDIAAATEMNIHVSNTPEAVATSTADLAIALLLMACRRLTMMEQFLRSGEYAKLPGHLNTSHGHDPAGKTLGIIGMGGIGKAVAKRARPFGLSILYHNRTRVSEEEEADLAATYVTLDDLLASADFITVHTPLTPQTTHLLSHDAFAKMKHGVYIINTARGAVIDTEALLANLKSKKVAGAGLDVHEGEPVVHPELIACPNVTLTPHIGTLTVETRTDMEGTMLNNLVAALEGGTPPNALTSW